MERNRTEGEVKAWTAWWWMQKRQTKNPFPSEFHEALSLSFEVWMEKLGSEGKGELDKE